MQYIPDQVQLQPIPKRNPTTLGEAFKASYNYHLWQNTSIGYIGNSMQKRKVRNQLIDIRQNTDLLPDEIMDTLSADGLYHDEIINYLRSINAPSDLLEGLMTDEEIYERSRKNLQFNQDYYEDVLSRLDHWAPKYLGIGGGLVGGTMTDITFLPGMFVSFGTAAKGASLLSKIGKTGTKFAALTAAEEVVRETMVYKHKKNIGVDYSLRDALTNIGIAVGFSYGLAGLGHTAADVLRATMGKGRQVIGLPPALEPDLPTSEGFAKKIFSFTNRTKTDDPAGKSAKQVLNQTARELKAGANTDPLEHTSKIEKLKRTYDESEPTLTPDDQVKMELTEADGRVKLRAEADEKIDPELDETLDIRDPEIKQEYEATTMKEASSAIEEESTVLDKIMRCVLGTV